MPHAEALLLVHDHQAQIAELHVLRQQPVCADEDIHFAFASVRQHALISLAVRKRLSISTRTGKGGKRRLKVSKCWKHEDGGRREHGDLLAVAERLESGAHDDLGFAEAHVAAEQPVHGLRLLHVALDVLDGGELVVGLGELEGVLELALPVAVGGESEPLGHLAFGVELEQLVRHVAHPGLDAFLGAFPGRAADAVERRGLLARAAEPLDQIHARQRDVEPALAGVFEQHIVAAVLAVLDLAQAEEASHAMLCVNDVVAGLEIDQVGGKGGQSALPEWLGSGHHSEASKRSSEPKTASCSPGNTTPRRTSPLTRYMLATDPAR